MIRDKNVALSDGQALTSTADSANTINLGEAGFGNLGKVWLVVMVGTELDSAGDAATLDIDVQSSTDDSSFVSNLKSPQILEASCTAGAFIWQTPLPVGMLDYVKLVYTVGTENFTSGTIYAWLSDHPSIEQ